MIRPEGEPSLNPLQSMLLALVVCVALASSPVSKADEIVFVSPLPRDWAHSLAETGATSENTTPTPWQQFMAVERVYPPNAQGKRAWRRDYVLKAKNGVETVIGHRILAENVTPEAMPQPTNELVDALLDSGYLITLERSRGVDYQVSISPASGLLQEATRGGAPPTGERPVWPTTSPRVFSSGCGPSILVRSMRLTGSLANGSLTVNIVIFDAPGYGPYEYPNDPYASDKNSQRPPEPATDTIQMVLQKQKEQWKWVRVATPPHTQPGG